MRLHLPKSIRELSDRKWLDMLIASTSKSEVAGIEFPGFPPEETQTTFVGSANEKALREAFVFYEFVKESARQYGNPLTAESRFLDFGCGWGRYLRFFWKDVSEENLFGCDVNQSIVDTCHALNVPGKIDHIDPRGSLPYRNGFFDSIIAYSVFTHLPEDVHVHWVRELARVARRDCIVCLTIESRRFIDFIASLPEHSSQRWYELLAIHKPLVREFYTAYDSGKFVFMPTNVGVEDTYGDAVVPLPFIERTWTPYFVVESYVDDPSKFWQAVLVLRRS